MAVLSLASQLWLRLFLSERWPIYNFYLSLFSVGIVNVKFNVLFINRKKIAYFCRIETYVNHVNETLHKHTMTAFGNINIINFFMNNPKTVP